MRNSLAVRLTLTLLSALFVGFLSLKHPSIAQSVNTQLSDELIEEFLVNGWMLISGWVVFFMNAGFAMLEAGSCQRKNVINILAKNLIVFCIVTLSYWAIGFGVMYGQDWNLGGSLFFNTTLRLTDSNQFPEAFENLKSAWPRRSFVTIFFYQLVFAGTSATIVSGAVAERIKFVAFCWFSLAMGAIIYPICGNLVWGSDGWLNSVLNLNFQDFAGSTVVHSVGGSAGLVGAFFLGKRRQLARDQYQSADLGLATLGCLILWLGWFGFNGGSAKYLGNVPDILLVTMLSAATGGITAVGLTIKQPDLLIIVNGILGGLVGVTASAGYITVYPAIAIGFISGLLVGGGQWLLEKIGIDDPVGAVPVHLFCGIWGTIAVGLFAPPSFPTNVDPSLDLTTLQTQPEFILRYEIWIQTLNQLLGSIIIVMISLALSILFWSVIGILLAQPMRGAISMDDIPPGPFQRNLFSIGRGIRVNKEEERQGEDGFFESKN